MMTVIELANAEQRAASNPAVSAFAAASAGSGKTKLLTDRLLRLMLSGTPPARILCLTFTKAAAAEMAIRLNRRLGAWVVLPEPALDEALAALDVPPGPTTRAAARKLFADVLDLPGGMRIETIHAFCQSLLRRFPLEAELSPHFELEDGFEAAARLRESREHALADAAQRDAILALAAETNEQDFAALTAKFAGDTRLPSLLREFGQDGVVAMQRAALGANELDDEKILAAAVAWDEEADVRAALQRIAKDGPPKAAAAALERLDWLAGDATARAANWAFWQASFFGEKKPLERSVVIGKKLAESAPELGEAIQAEQMRIAAVEDARKTSRLAVLNENLIALAAPILQAESHAKHQQALVTYADLIAITLELLKKPEDAAWILYKLDGGIDHLLLDEVQDTAPAQWRIADAIAVEFFSGLGAREVQRSIFAVGDPKQSIFGFQGADLAIFHEYQHKFRARVEAAGQTFLDGRLSVSFRSTEPVLALVDAVFAEGKACEGVCEPGALTHGVSRAGQAGSVTRWPLTLATEPAELPAWTAPDEYAAAQSAKTALAKTIARHIQATLAAKTPLPSRNRVVTPGDFLILVRQRDELVTAITRECKALNIAIAGADRMVLTQQQAVSDLLALCDALLLPEDDLAFGQYLASPLGGLTDESLMELALRRPGRLSAALFARRAEREDWAAANDYFQRLRSRVDYISPYAVLAEALGPLGGRAKLLRRLGPEAAEPIDELLAEAMEYAGRHPSSMQNFLFTLRQSGAEIKREAEAAGDMVRIMTVHGAKGLQAPIVILPDTTSLPRISDSLFWLQPPQQAQTVPVFCPRTELRNGIVTAANEASKTAQLAEYNRLLYVALTRAEDELIVCGAKGKNTPPEHCWYNLIKAGFDRLGGDHFTTPQTAAPDRAGTSATTIAATLPGWAGLAPDWLAAPPATEATRPEPLAPSRGAEEPASLASAASPLGHNFKTARDAALAKGVIVHALLQHLPDLAAAERRAAGAKYLAQPGLGLDAAAQAGMIAAVLTILENPALVALFGPGSRAEVPIAGVLGEVEIGGLIDRLAVGADEILIADYKTNRAPPLTPAEIPPAYLRQLAAYRAILAQIYPRRPITCLLIWTETAVVMKVPEAMLARHAPAQAQPYPA